MRQGEGQGGGEGQRAGQGGRAGTFLEALLLLRLLLAKGEGGGDGQGERVRVRRGAAGPTATGVRWTQGGRREEGQREGWRQRARPGTVGVTHGLSEGLKGGSGRDLHAGLLPGGYALPPGAMICEKERRSSGKTLLYIRGRKTSMVIRGQDTKIAVQDTGRARGCGQSNVEINSCGTADIDILPEGTKEYESSIEVKGERDRNKTMQGHTHSPASLQILPLHRNSYALSSVESVGADKVER